MRLTNRQAAERLGVSLGHVARACEHRGIQRDAQGYYLFPSGEHEEPKPVEPLPQAKAYEPAFTSKENPAPSGRPFRLVAFASDIHIPEHDPFAVRAWLSWVQHAQPDVIVLGGDILELESCSGHGGNIHSAPLFTHEIECGNKFLDDVQAAAPGAEIHYLEGNHETRLGRKVDAMIPTMSGALDLPSLLRLDERGISWLPYGKVKRFGSSKLAFTHGLRANDHHAKAHLALYGSSIVYGHTHRPQTYVQGYGDNKVRAGIGAPCLRSLDVSWIKGPTGWAQGFVIAHMFEDGHFTFYPVLMDRQRFVEGGRLYDGRA